MAIDERKRLVRSEQNKVLAGVAGGIGAHFNVDPILVRIAFVLLALVDGIGVIGYLAAWALIPKEGELRSPAESAMAKVSGDGEGKNNTWIWIAILAIAGVLILANLTHWDWDAGLVIWALVLIGAGAWLYRQDINGRRGPGGDGPLTGAAVSDTTPPGDTSASNLPVLRSDTTPAVDPPEPPAGPVASSANPHPSGTAIAASETSAASETTISERIDPANERAAPLTGPPVVTASRKTTITRTAPPHRPRSNLGRYTFAVALLVVGIAALLENAGNIDLSGIQYGGLILTTIGAGLLVGTFWGRSRLLILAGLVLLPLMFATNLLGGWFSVPIQAGAGDRFFAPSTVEEVRDSYELTAGALNLDLTEMAWGPDPVEIEATVGFGEVNVLVPQGVAVDILARATIGAVSLFGDERAGFGVRLDIADIRRENEPRLILDVRTLTGQVEVARSGERARGT